IDGAETCLGGRRCTGPSRGRRGVQSAADEGNFWGSPSTAAVPVIVLVPLIGLVSRPCILGHATGVITAPLNEGWGSQPGALAPFQAAPIASPTGMPTVICP